jgi:hypothetical protein
MRCISPDEVDIRPSTEGDGKGYERGSSTGEENGGSTGDSTGGIIALAIRWRVRFVWPFSLSASLPISNRLLLPAFFPSVGGTITAIGLLLRPATRGGRTFGTAVPRERMRWIESTLATL